MSSENSPTKKAEKMKWHAQIKTTPRIYHAVTEEARREERSLSYVVSRALEIYYEERSKLKVI